jgi:glutamine amidotransferase
MCRLYGFLSNEPTKVDCSLVFAQNALLLQSRADEIGRHHADGWGIATYQDGEPALIKNTTAAFDDRSFSSEAEKLYTTAAIAHIRKATVGTPSQLNTHPFQFLNWVFAHNGTVTGFDRIESQLASETLPEYQKLRKGTTDSEQYFLWLLTQLRESNLLSPESTNFSTPTNQQIKGHLRRAVMQLESRCLKAVPSLLPRLNFLLTDGTTLVACRWNNSLHMISRNGLYECEICGVPHIHHHETVSHQAVAFASEPITGETWNAVPNKSFSFINLNVDRTVAQI